MQIPGVTDLLKPEFFTSLSGGRGTVPYVPNGTDELNRSSASGSASSSFVPQLLLPALSYAEFQQFLVNGQKNFHISSSDIRKLQAAQQDLLTHMMENWSKSIDELNRYLEAKRNSSFQRLLDFIDAQVKKGTIPTAQAYSGIMILLSFMGPTWKTTTPPLNGAWDRLLPFVDKNVKDELTLFVSWNSLQLPYQFALIQPMLTASMLITKAGLSPREAMAKGYAYTIYNQINLPIFDELVRQYLLKLIPSMSPSELANTVAKVRLAYLLCALAMLYKAETGGGTPEELKALLTGEMKLPQEGLLSTLARLIQLELGKIHSDERKSVLDALIDYVGSDPSFESLLSPASTLEDSWSKETGATVNTMLESIG